MKQASVKDTVALFKTPHPFTGGLLIDGYWHFGDRNVIEKTYGLNYDDVIQQHGLDPKAKGRGTRVHVLPIEWFYQ